MQAALGAHLSTGVCLQAGMPQHVTMQLAGAARMEQHSKAAARHRGKVTALTSGQKTSSSNGCTAGAAAPRCTKQQLVSQCNPSAACQQGAPATAGDGRSQRSVAFCTPPLSGVRCSPLVLMGLPSAAAAAAAAAADALLGAGNSSTAAGHGKRGARWTVLEAAVARAAAGGQRRRQGAGRAQPAIASTQRPPAHAIARSGTHRRALEPLPRSAPYRPPSRRRPAWPHRIARGAEHAAAAAAAHGRPAASRRVLQRCRTAWCAAGGPCRVGGVDPRCRAGSQGTGPRQQLGQKRTRAVTQRGRAYRCSTHS